ncbi:MAG: WbqC family protein [Solibacillus sp.]|uniref:WbqC family protein n=1 Tax=Solibacillus sp. TaxID=1909654 RepID=UPI003314E1AD
MNVALMQPYFFPYLGYFQLIHAVDEFVVFDQAQYIRRGWINRNRLLNPHKESVYINVPVHKAPRETKIKDILINHTSSWKDTIFQQLSYYRKAPNYAFVLDFMTDCLASDAVYLSELNTSVLKKVCVLLEIDTKITVLSERLPLLTEMDAADDWGIAVSKALHATTYINAIGGMDFYDQQKYHANDLAIQFIKTELKPYQQFHNEFVPGLSIIDVLMFNEPEQVKQMLEIHELIK